MGRLGLALKILFDGSFAKSAQRLLETPADSGPEDAAVPSAAPAPKPAPTRSEALTLLAAFQREARLVDFLQEPIDGYSDAQVGAAVREIHRGCREVVQRMFAPSAVVNQAEGSLVEVADATSERYRLSGRSSGAGNGTVSGRLAHHGWKADRCEIPQWNGAADAALVIGPAEIEIQ